MFLFYMSLCSAILEGGFSEHTLIPNQWESFVLLENYKLIIFSPKILTVNIIVSNKNTNATYKIIERAILIQGPFASIQNTDNDSVTIGVWHLPTQVCSGIIQYHSGCNLSHTYEYVKKMDVCIFPTHPQHLYSSYVEARDYQSSIINYYNNDFYESPYSSYRRTLTIKASSPYFVEYKSVKSGHKIEIIINFLNSGTDYDSCDYGSISAYDTFGITNNFDENNKTVDQCTNCAIKPDPGGITDGLKILIGVAATFITICIIIPSLICIGGAIKKKKKQNKNKAIRKQNGQAEDIQISDNSVISYSNLYSLNLQEKYNRYTEPLAQESHDDFVHPPTSPYH